MRHGRRCDYLSSFPAPLKRTLHRPSTTPTYRHLPGGHSLFRVHWVLTYLFIQATKYLYNQSLFVRLQKLDPDAVHLLRYTVFFDTVIKSLTKTCKSMSASNTECTQRSADYQAVFSTRDDSKMVQGWLQKLLVHGTQAPYSGPINFSMSFADKSHRDRRTR